MGVWKSNKSEIQAELEHTRRIRDELRTQRNQLQAERDRYREDSDHAQREANKMARLADRYREALAEAIQTLASFEGLIGYGPDCDEKIERWQSLIDA